MSVANFLQVYDLREVASDVDVLYMTRIQKERFSDMKEYEKAKGKYVLNADLMTSMHKDAVVLHPLPRVDEVSCTKEDACVCVAHKDPHLPSDRSSSPTNKY
jgi:aspartate carbamoyltransferase catalytic subunit